MSNTQVSIIKNGTTTLATAGKYCDRNIDVKVSVSQGVFPSGTLYATENGDYYVRNYDHVNVNVGTNTKDIGLMLSGHLEHFYNNYALSLKMYCFYKVYSLISASLPKVEIVNEEAFNSCTNLINPHLPKAKTLKRGSFKHCWHLERADFPSVTLIANEVFYGDTMLKTIVIGTTRCTLEHSNSFMNTKIGNGEGYIYVPDEAVEWYKTATNWSTYASQIKGISELS